jgi:hypothetical protein
MALTPYKLIKNLGIRMVYTFLGSGDLLVGKKLGGELLTISLIGAILFGVLAKKLK